MRRRKPWKIGEEKILGKERVSAGVLSLIYSGKQEGYESGREYTKMEQGGVQKSDPIESYVVVQLLTHIRLFVTLWTAAHQVPLPFTSPRVCSASCPLSQWCYLPILSSVVPSSFCFQSFPASESFPMSQLLSMNIQGWYALGLTGLIPLLSKGLSRVFDSTTTQKY